MNKINKKAVSLSLQTVVVGIMLLIVLAVVLIIFTKNIGKQDTIVGDQIGKLGDCFDGDSECSLIPSSSENDDPSSPTPETQPDK